MDINALKKMSYEEVRHLYMPFLQSQGVGPNTIKTAYVDSFYLWRKGDHDLFWKAVESNDADAKAMFLDALRKNTTGDAEKLVSGYLSHLRRFRLFLASEGTAEPKTVAAALTKPTAPVQYRRKADIDVPHAIEGTGGVVPCQMGRIGELPPPGGCPGQAVPQAVPEKHGHHRYPAEGFHAE